MLGERGGEDKVLASNSMPGLGSRKAAGGMKAGLPRWSASSVSRGRAPNTDCILCGLYVIPAVTVEWSAVGDCHPPLVAALLHG